MKNTKTLKIFSIILSVALLVIGAVAITASATETETTVEITSKNLSYDSNISIMFAVKVENQGENSVLLNVYTKDPQDDQTLTPVTVEPTYTPENSEEKVGYADAYIFFTEGIPAKALETQIYAQAVVGDAVSEVERYSIVEYCHEMNAKNDTTLYSNIITYGATVQEMLRDDGKFDDSYAYATEYKYVTIENGTLDGRYDSGIYLAGEKITPAIDGVETLDAKLASGTVSTVVSGAEYTVADSVAFSIADVPANPHTFEGITEIPAGLTVVPLADAPSVVNQSGTLPSMSPEIRSSGISGNSTGILFWNNLDGDSTVLKIDETADDKANANAVEFSCDMLINYQSTTKEEREFVNIVFTKADGTVAYNLILRNTQPSATSTNIGVCTRDSAGSISGQGTFVQNADNIWFNIRAVYTTTDTGIEVTLYANGNEFAQKHTDPYTEGNIVSADDIANVYIYANTHSDDTVNIHYQFALDNINLQHVKVD
ncbi:MAG: hypothetical protein IJW66_05470 [Clostridia bacterium]|nr:hypothetical protein [Clostridia bacterium]